MMDQPIHEVVRIVRKLLKMKESIHYFLNNDNNVSLLHVPLNILCGKKFTYRD